MSPVALLELAAPSVPDELVERVLSGQVEASPAAIRRERSSEGSAERGYEVGGTFIDLLMRFKGTGEDFAAGVAAHVLRRWRDGNDREWFANCLATAAVMIDDNLAMKVPLLELPSTTARKLKERAR